jgi:hypothetical protein
MYKWAPIVNETLAYWDELHPTYPHGIGINNQSDPRSKMANPEHRIFYLVYKSVHSGLGGASLARVFGW